MSMACSTMVVLPGVPRSTSRYSSSRLCNCPSCLSDNLSEILSSCDAGSSFHRTISSGSGPGASPVCMHYLVNGNFHWQRGKYIVVTLCFLFVCSCSFKSLQIFMYSCPHHTRNAPHPATTVERRWALFLPSLPSSSHFPPSSLLSW